MTMTWKIKGGTSGTSSHRYTQITPEFPATEWATDQLSQAYDRVRSFMEAAQVESRINVMAASRVDTGFMRSNVESTLATPGEQIVLEFGWWEGVPHYAPYQEFGTQYIEPMLAVQREFLQVQHELRDAVIP